ncbi:PREDICTED: protein-arginine deiminase type-2-like, partial [Priapulus caudatus]|uniref:Protein-arginine deiminase type-2-like n=1 Tax=Priapulus caudatus TaxID=37621 RepID=A0ABM1E6T1_PRICU
MALVKALLVLLAMVTMTTAQFRHNANNVEPRGRLPGGRGPRSPCGSMRQAFIRLGGFSEETLVSGYDLCIDLSRVSPDGATKVEAFNPDGERGVIVSLEHEPTYTIAIVHSTNISHAPNDKRVIFQFEGAKGLRVGQAELKLTVIWLSLDVDTDRDGVVDVNSPYKNSWAWGPNGHGAIVLANLDKDAGNTFAHMRDSDDDVVSGPPDLQDLAAMRVHSDGPPQLHPDYKLVLFIDETSVPYVRVFGNRGRTKFIGPRLASMAIAYPGSYGSHKYEVEALSYAHSFFDGFIRLHLALKKGNDIVFQDTVQFKVSPWLMTSNLLPADIVFMSRADTNGNFVREMQTFIEENMSTTVRTCPREVCRDDRWIQDQLEFGYTEVPKNPPMSAVLKSPRVNGLKDYGYTNILGPNVAFVEYQSAGSTELDYFGNLEVSPPVTVNNTVYPLGRIYYGNGNYPGGWRGRKTSNALIGFLEAQIIQAPIELFSDWLFVGHVDEFMSVIPAPNTEKGFKIVLSSTRAFYDIMNDLQGSRYGDLLMFADKPLSFYRGEADITVSQFLSNDKFYDVNQRCQEYLDYNRGILTRELGLDHSDVIEIPAIYDTVMGRDNVMRVTGYFPNLVNLLVLNNYVILPKPYGPVIRGVDVLANNVKNIMHDLGLS